MSAVIILLRTLVVFIAAVVAFLSMLDNQSCDLLSRATVGWLPRLCKINGRYKIRSADLVAIVRNHNSRNATVFLL